MCSFDFKNWRMRRVDAFLINIILAGPLAIKMFATLFCKVKMLVTHLVYFLKRKVTDVVTIDRRYRFCYDKLFATIAVILELECRALTLLPFMTAL
jgi:hypothetical protein